MIPTTTHHHVTVAGMRVIACSAAALALTLSLSWGFVTQTSDGRWASLGQGAGPVLVEATARLAQGGVAALVD
jgi:hypothetical protein